MNMTGAWIARLIAIAALLAAFVVRRATGSQTAFWICVIVGAVCVLFAALRSISPPRRDRELPPKSH